MCDEPKAHLRGRLRQFILIPITDSPLQLNAGVIIKLPYPVILLFRAAVY